MTSIRRVPLDRFSSPPDRTHPFPVDVENRGDEIRISADLPGLRTQDIDVSARKTRVRITADYGESAGAANRLRGAHSRVIRLPVRIDETRAAASYIDGVLRIRLPKRDRSETVDIA